MEAEAEQTEITKEGKFEEEAELKSSTIEDKISIGENNIKVNKVDQPDPLNLSNAFYTDQVFHSKEALITWAKQTGKEIGYVIMIKASQPQVGGRKARLRLTCERGGTYKPPKNKASIDTLQRKGTGTKKCGCPFLLHGVKLEGDDDWGVKVVCGFHNHPPAEQFEGHSYAGRLTKKEESVLMDMTKNMVKPRHILMTIKDHDKNNVTTMKTIYNARHRHRIVEKAGRSQMKQLMKKLNECKYMEWHRRNESTDSVTDLFWAHPISIDILHAFPSVLIMDCTYKTNRYKFPLLEIVGVTCTNLTFSIAFVYIEAECEENFTWAMEKLKSMMSSDILPGVIVTDRELALINAIKEVFPTTSSLLCRWHITKNVLANTKKLFGDKGKFDAFMSAWSVLMHSSNEDAYARNLSSIQNDFKTYPEALKYINDAWLTSYKERFVAAWTDRIMHFGNLTTNRVESAHSKLKKFLGSSQADFDSSWNTINSLIELQHTEIKASFEKSLNVVEHNFAPALFKDLRGFVSRNALNMILIESKRANDIGIDRVLCGCVIRGTHGLPCAHEIAGYLRDGHHIPLDAVHPHWMKLDLKKCKVNDLSFELNIEDEMRTIWSRFAASDVSGKLVLKRKLRELGEPSTTFLMPPSDKAKTKGRRSLKADSSTRRDPSYFEIVESALANETQPSENSITVKKKQKLSIKRSRRVDQYWDSIPLYIQEYIMDITDVLPDGHCGFRSVAGLLGFGSDDWLKVRQDLIEELCNYRSYYVNLYGSNEVVATLLDRLSCSKVTAPKKNWMTLPDMGHLIASKYNVIFVHISRIRSLTYLPLRSTPPLPSKQRIIVIGFVNDNHFVQISMDPESPIPPVVSTWYAFRCDNALGWEIPYLTRIEAFKSLIKDSIVVATQETIILDEP